MFLEFQALQQILKRIQVLQVYLRQLGPILCAMIWLWFVVD